MSVPTPLQRVTETLVRRALTCVIGGVVAGALSAGALDAQQAPRRFTTQTPCNEVQLRTGCLIVLGSGMPIPDPERAGPSYAVLYGERTFIFDAGANVMRRIAAAGLPIDRVTAAFLTHLHSDHTLGLPDLLLTTWVMGRRDQMPLFGPPGTGSMVGHIMAAWSEDNQVRSKGLERLPSKGREVNLKETRGGILYDSAGVRITAIRVTHGDFKVALSYVIRTPARMFVLSGDTAPSDALTAAATGADVLVHEVYPSVRLKPENRPGGEQWPAYMRSVHTSDVEVGAMAAKAGVKAVVLSHIVRMGGTDDELLAGIARGGYHGVVHIAKDLDAY